MKNITLKMITGVAAICLCQNSMATLLDFTDDSLIDSLTSISNGYSGSIDGVGFTLTSDDGIVNFNQNYDGNNNSGCQSNGGVLACDSDGAGINNDEITGGTWIQDQALTLTFDHAVSISAFYFLDLYRQPGFESYAGEQATISIDGTIFDTVDAVGTTGDGGYADLITSPVLAQTIVFTAVNNPIYWDDWNNDYSLAGIEVNPTSVPEPHTLLLLGTGLFGLVGLKKRKNKRRDQGLTGQG